jgi:hypothetical protein
MPETITLFAWQHPVSCNATKVAERGASSRQEKDRRGDRRSHSSEVKPLLLGGVLMGRR